MTNNKKNHVSIGREFSYSRPEELVGKWFYEPPWRVFKIKGFSTNNDRSAFFQIQEYFLRSEEWLNSIEFYPLNSILVYELSEEEALGLTL